MILAAAALALLGVAVGAGIGASTATHDTSTRIKVLQLTRHETQTVVKRKIVRPPPRIIRRTVTREVLASGDNAFDYGNYAGRFTVRGLEGYSTDYGPEILGQIQALGGCDGYVQLDATFYNNSRIVATDFTNFTSLPAGSWVPFKITPTEDIAWDTYDVLLSRADC